MADFTFVENAYVEVSWSGGSARLNTAVKFGVDVDEPTEAVKTMNAKRRALGYRHGVPEFKLSLDYAQLVGGDEIPWEFLRRTRETFLVIVQEGENGRRVQYRDCTVTSHSKSWEESGATSTSVEMMALDELEE